MRSFFLVPYKVLVEQQAKEIVDYTDFEEGDVGRFTGDLNVDSWRKEDWIKKFIKYKILVMTAQIFKDLVDKDYLPLSKVNLIVFDECHHAALKKKGKETNHVYRLIMQTVKQKAVTSKPRILGLTASVINNKAEANMIKDLVTDLEKTYSARCLSVEPSEVLRYRTKAVQVVWKCRPNFGAHKTAPIVYVIADVLRELEPKFKEWKLQNPSRKLPIDWHDIKTSLTNISDSATDFGTWFALQACDMYSKELWEQYEFFEATMPRYGGLLVQLLNFLGWCQRVHKFVIDIHCLLLPGISRHEVECLRLVPPKVLRLLQVLENYSTGRRKLKGIIFVEKRWDAKILSMWLDEVSKLIPSLSFLKPGYLIGYSARPGLTSKLVAKTKSEQNKTIARFREKDQNKNPLNILVATSVLEEGLNVTECNLVVRYHPPATFKSWLQSSGRARDDESRYVLMTTMGREEDTLLKNLSDFAATDKALNEYCLKRKLDSEHADNSATDDEDRRDRDLLEGQTVRSRTTEATIDAAKAISVVNSYCQQLGADWVSQPIDETLKVANQFIHEVRLPSISQYALKVTGKRMSNAKSAKKSAYLYLCSRLYEAGGLDENLQPVRKSELIRRAIEKLNVGIPQEEVPEGTAKAGTSKRKQVYAKSVHPCLVKKDKATWFLYGISITEDRKVFLADIESADGQSSVEVPRRTCGFLTRQEIPLDSTNSSFPVFKRNFLKMDATIELIAENITFSDTEITQLKTYHQYLFNEVLGFRQSRFKYAGLREDRDTRPVTDFLVVPLSMEGGIDFDFMERVERKRNESTGVEINEEGIGISRHDFFFKKEDYDGFLVMRWYNHADNQNSEIAVDGEENDETRILFTGAFRVLKVTSPCSGCYKCESCGNCRKCPSCEECRGLNPRSKFPHEKRDGKNHEKWEVAPKTFEDYYFRKYGIVIQDLDQPLLEVDYTEKLATPHIPVQMRGARLFDRKQHFVPELCLVCPIPVPLWEDAVCLPSIFFRLNQLLQSATILTILRREARINGVHKMVRSGPLHWKSSVFSIVDRRWEVPRGASKKELSDNWDFCDAFENLHVNDEDNEGSDMELDDETGEIFHLNKKKTEQCSDPIPRNVLGPSETLMVDTDQTNLYDDVRIDSLIKHKTVTVEPQLDQAEIQKGMNDCVQKIASALNLITNEARGLEFYPFQMDDVSKINTPRRDLDGSEQINFDQQKGYLTPEVILEALTCKSARDYLNMERFETMGDSFLKLATIEYFHSKGPELPEGCLTEIKSQHVSNYNLYRLAKNLDLGNRIQVQLFHGHVSWSPPGFVTILKDPSIPDTTTCHHVSDKQIADCVESLIGAILLNCGRIDAIKFMSYIGLRVTDLSLEELCRPNGHWINKNLVPYSQTLVGKPDLEREARFRIAELYNNSYLSRVEQIIDYKFRDKGWLLMAYTHPSNTENDVTGCYQRLELLGDAVLDFLITRYLFDQKTRSKNRVERYFDPGELTDLRSALVNNVFFGCVLTKYHLHKSLLASPDTKAQVNSIANSFIQEFDDPTKTRRYLEDILGFYVIKQSQETVASDEVQNEEGSSIEMPKILGDILEALFGAIYLDSGRDLNVVWRILYSMISEELSDFCVRTPLNPVHQVMINDVKAKFDKPTFDDKDQRKRKVLVRLRYRNETFEGEGRNKKMAKIAAAKKAIREHETTLKLEKSAISGSK